jgi:hypothetical protein
VCRRLYTKLKLTSRRRVLNTTTQRGVNRRKHRPLLTRASCLSHSPFHMTLLDSLSSDRQTVLDSQCGLLTRIPLFINVSRASILRKNGTPFASSHNFPNMPVSGRHCLVSRRATRER